MHHHRKTSSKRRPRRLSSGGPALQRMGGKEERISLVGKARAEVERSEEEGEIRFDIAPGPRTEELGQGPGPRSIPPQKERLPDKPVSLEPRGGTEGLEPEDKV